MQPILKEQPKPEISKEEEDAVKFDINKAIATSLKVHKKTLDKLAKL